MMEPNELQRASDIIQMSKSAAFGDLKEMLGLLVEEAHEAIVGCVSNEPLVHLRLTVRYQQRIGVKREIDRFVESAQKAIDENTELMRQELERMEAEGALNR